MTKFYNSDICSPSKEGDFFVSDDGKEIYVAEWRDGCFYTYYASVAKPLYWAPIEKPSEVVTFLEIMHLPCLA